MAEKSVAIVMPVYNGREFMRDAIESIIAQTYCDWHLYIINDGSTDESGSIARAYSASDDRITVTDTPNRGLSAARNAGIRFATEARIHSGIVFIDADDALHREALRIMTSVNADLVVGGFSFCQDFMSKPLGKVNPRFLSPTELVEETLYQRGAVHAAWGKLYNRLDIFSQELFTEGILYEDLDFFYRYSLRCSSTAVIDAPIYFYRQHAASIVHSWNDRRLDVLDVTLRLEKFMAAGYPQLLAAARDRRLSANFNMFLLASQNNLDDVAASCWSIIKKYRNTSLLDKKVRFKNKAGIILSYFGPTVLKKIAKWVGA